MKIDISKIVSADELALDTSLIKNKLDEQEELIVFNNNQPQFVIMTLERLKTQNNNVSQKYEIPKNEFVKIGKFVQDTFRRFMSSNKLPEDEIKRLCDSDYSYNSFNLNFPVLKLYDDMISFNEQKRDANGYNRYYNFILNAYGHHYLLCSQFVEYLHRKKLEIWIERWEKQ